MNDAGLQSISGFWTMVYLSSPEIIPCTLIRIKLLLKGLAITNRMSNNLFTYPRVGTPHPCVISSGFEYIMCHLPPHTLTLCSLHTDR